MKTYHADKLEGALLDAAVAKAEGLRWRILEEAESPIGRRLTVAWPAHHAPTMSSAEEFEPSTDWAAAGPIIERERIVFVRDDAVWVAAVCDGLDPGGDLILRAQHWTASGPSALVAAMRAYVGSKFGEEVALP